MSFLNNIFGKIFPASHPAVAAPQATPPVDVEAVVSSMAQKKTEQLNWRTSIVDLLKVLDLDSSITARKSLAKELNYTGNMEDSTAMNIWLHAQVMKKIEANGGTLPKDLRTAA
jgi:hypothetical protein